MKQRPIMTLIGAALSVLAVVPAQAEGWLKDPVTGCELWHPEDPGADEVVSWSGACVDGKAEGRGVGTWVDGKGLLGRFEGTMRAGKAEGSATAAIRDEDDATTYNHYDGNFQGGLPAGQGTLVTASGYEVSGEVLGGLDHMRGTLVAPDGDMVRGEFKDEKIVGEAFAYYVAKDDSVYFGDVVDGKREGRGMLELPNEDIYVGEFKAGDASGYGTYHAESGEHMGVYVGVFAKGTPNGPGTFVAADGEVTQGRFVDGKPEGLALVTMPDGTQTTETWKDGEKMK